MYDVRFTKQAVKDSVNIERSGLKSKVLEMVGTVREDPFEPSQSFEELKGDLKGVYTRRINIRHRFVYEVLPNDENAVDPNSNEPYDGIVKVISIWTHYT